MVNYLVTRGFDRQQACALCSCAVDLPIAPTVDAPNNAGDCALPLDIFSRAREGMSDE